MINKVIILALDKRKDLWRVLREDCNKRNWDTRAYIVGSGTDSELRYDSIDPLAISPSWRYASGVSAYRHYCAFVSHQKIIRMALSNGWNNILLLEDDSYLLHDRLDKILPEIAYEIPQYDLIYLGWWAFEMDNHLHAGTNLTIEKMYREEEKFGLSSIPQCGGFHAVIINKSAYVKLLSLPPVAPMDYQVNLNSHMFSRRIVLPKLVHVRSTYSYCEDSFVQRDIM